MIVREHVSQETIEPPQKQNYDAIPREDLALLHDLPAVEPGASPSSAAKIAKDVQELEASGS